MKHYIKYFLLSTLLVACRNETEEELDNQGTVTDLAIPDWTDATHSNKAEPNYEIVFPQNQVNTIEIAMTKEDWSAIQTNMTSLFGFSFGSGGTQPGGAFPEVEPDYVSVSLKFNGREWYKVGFRLKGNSTLRNSWRQGIYKLPFRLNLDRYEDTYPQLKNQRFYGFKELSLSPGANDNSLIREKVGSDIFRAAGLPCAQTAFCKVYINFGDGLKYCGVYTMVEVVDDTLVKNYFGSDKGNIYKPESTFQTFIQSQFEKKNNEAAGDYSDVQATLQALHSSLRTSDPASWRANLEKNFNADHFMKWLAVNTTMLNWDTYGRMAHNYYLYNEAGKGLTWIPWDNNECLMNRGNNTYTISLSTTGANWPLIRYLMDDPVYNAKYKFYMKEFTDNVFIPDKMNALFTRYHNLISPFVIGPQEMEQFKYTHLQNATAFTASLESLKLHVATQVQAAAEYLK
jgi:spore coat protein H